MKAIEAIQLEKNYDTIERKGFFKRKKKTIKALNKVTFHVQWGEVFGLLGPNGAGKTTTIKILTTLLLPDNGKAIVAGHDVIKQANKVREKIGVVLSVEKGFFWKLTGKENLKYFGMLRGMKGDKLEKRIDETLELVGLKKLGAENKLYEEYSLGMKARLSLARAILHDPPILILDEPTLGLDPPAARSIRELLIYLAHKERKAVLVTTHNMYEAELICDRIAIISNGKITGIGTPAELKKKVADEIPIEITLTGKITIEIEKLRETLTRETGLNATIKNKGDHIILRALAPSETQEESLSLLLEKLSKKGLKVKRIQIMEPSLEDVFIKMTA